MTIKLKEVEYRLKKIEELKLLFEDLKEEMVSDKQTEMDSDNYQLSIQDAAQESNSLTGYLLQVL